MFFIVVGGGVIGVCILIEKEKERVRKERLAAIEAYVNNPENAKKFFKAPLTV